MRTPGGVRPARPALVTPAGSQGAGALPRPLLDALDISLPRKVAGLLPGGHGASGLGHGIELAQLRPYAPGDDVRAMDWPATARTTIPHVRVYVPDRGLSTWIVLDVSPSMAFGTADRLKSDVAAGVAEVVARVGTRRSDSVGLLVCGNGGPVRVLPPRHGRGGLLGIRRALADGVAPDGDAGEGLASALLRAGRVARRRGLVVVVSDLLGPRDWRPALAALRHRHAVLVCEIRDPREDALPDVGHLRLVDPETGARVHVDTSRRKLRERYAEAMAAERAAVAAELRRARVEHVVLSTDGDWLRTLGEALR